MLKGLLFVLLVNNVNYLERPKPASIVCKHSQRFILDLFVPNISFSLFLTRLLTLLLYGLYSLIGNLKLRGSVWLRNNKSFWLFYVKCLAEQYLRLHLVQSQFQSVLLRPCGHISHVSDLLFPIAELWCFDTYQVTKFNYRNVTRSKHYNYSYQTGMIHWLIFHFKVWNDWLFSVSYDHRKLIAIYTSMLIILSCSITMSYLTLLFVTSANPSFLKRVMCVFTGVGTTRVISAKPDA